MSSEPAPACAKRAIRGLLSSSPRRDGIRTVGDKGGLRAPPDPMITRLASAPMSDSLRVERPSDGVTLLTLNQPDRRNAMTGELTDAWGRAIAELAEDRDVRCVVVTGEG